MFKCISKIIENMLQSVLPMVVSGSQSAFVSSRSISNNIFLVLELVKGYGIGQISPRCALKIDLHKAFDSVSWNFILDILNAMKFSALFVEWTRACLTTSRFSIAVNGGLEGYFQGTRGIR